MPCVMTLSLYILTAGQSISASAKRTFGDQQVDNGIACDQMTVNDPVEVFATGPAVPISAGIDQCDRPLTAHSEAASLGAQDGALHVDEARIAQTPLEVIPSLLALLERGALARADTQEDMTACITQVQAVNDALQFARIVHGRSLRSGRHRMSAQIAWSSASPVRIRTTRSISETKILPSPTLPVRAAPTIASTT